MILLTSLIVSLAPLQEPPVAWQPLPLSTPQGSDPEGEESLEGATYEKDLRYKNVPRSSDENSYFGPENEEYNEEYIHVPYTPPDPLPEILPPPPDPSYVWTNGYWRWQEDHWLWIYGQWEKPPFAGARWEPGVWENREGQWYWRKGRWAQP